MPHQLSVDKIAAAQRRKGCAPRETPERPSPGKRKFPLVDCAAGREFTSGCRSEAASAFSLPSPSAGDRPVKASLRRRKDAFQDPNAMNLGRFVSVKVLFL